MIPDEEELPVGIAGDRMERSLAGFKQACGVLIAEEQERPLPNNALIGVLRDGVQLARELDERGPMMPSFATEMRLMTLARDKCLEQIRLLEHNRDEARRWNESHIKRLEDEIKRLRSELEAAKTWQHAYQKGATKRRIVG